MHHRLHKALDRSINQQRGFTLVEMLVAVALVLLMMSLFAEIFSLAIGSMSRQKGVAENDQRARMMLTLLKGDLEKRTFRDVVPFAPGMSTDIPYVKQRLSQRKGYLCYSENDPLDETDDTLRLTIDISQVSQNSDSTPLYGRTTEIGTGGLTANSNQPESDDGKFSAVDNTGMSDWAEVVYFMRGGRLYRRQMLIRKPYIYQALSDPTSNPPMPVPVLGTSYNFGSNIFWKDFDYSAYYDNTNNRTRFHDKDSLSNDGTGTSIDLGGGFTVPISLGIPHFRFGHTAFVASGVPKEFLAGDNSGIGNFIGSYTHEETSHPSFVYPGQSTNAGNNPHSRTDYNFDTTGPDPFAVFQLKGGTRAGEDLLLTNVLSFDVKIWDPGVSLGQDGVPGDGMNRPYAASAVGDDDGDGVVNNAVERGWKNSDDGDWRDLGHNDSQGYYFRKAGDGNGNGTAYGNRFDTWHPAGALTQPPYRAMYYYPSGSTAAINHPWRVPNRGFWAAATNYSVGDVIFPTNSGLQGNTFVYRCLATRFTSQSGAVAPVAWPTEPGQTLVDGDVSWECVENTIPAKGLQFKIRYLDISSGLVRDLTYVQYLTVPD